MTCRAPRRAVTNVVLDFLKLQLLHAELRLRRRLHESKVKTVCAVAQPSLGSEQPHPRARAENKVSSLSSSVSPPSASLLATGTGVLTKLHGDTMADVDRLS